MRWMLVVVLLVGCERQVQPKLWHAAKVGERRSAMQQFNATIDGPDGRKHTIESSVETTLETVAVDAEYPTRLRTTFIRHEVKFDGVAKPSMQGTFEITDSGAGAIDVTRVGGTITPDERAFFTGSWHGSRSSFAAMKRFAQQSFKPGQKISMTPDEVAGLGLDMSSVDLTVKDVTGQAVVFQIESIGALPGLDATLKGAGTLRIFEGGRELAQDAELLRDSKPIGTLRITQRSEYVLPK